MKRVLSLLLTIAMAAQLLVVPAFAEEAQNGIAVLSSAEVAHGEVAELALSLQDFENATSIAVKVHSELEVFGYTWSEVFAGDLCDFDYNKKQGVWATAGEDAIDVNRTVAIMSFIVPDEQATDPTISCDVIVEIDGVRHTVSTSGTITVKHAYGEWYETKEATLGEAGEEQRDCAVCDAYETRVIPVLEAVAMVGEEKFVTLKEAVEFVQTTPAENRDPVLVLKDCEISETIKIDNEMGIFSERDENNNVVVRNITSSAAVAFEISDGAFLLMNDLNVTTNIGTNIFKISDGTSGVLLAGCNLSGASEAAIHVAQGVQPIVDGEGKQQNNIEIYSTSISGGSAIELNGSGLQVEVASDGTFAATGDEGVIVVNGDEHYVGIKMLNFDGDNAFVLNGDSTIKLENVRFKTDGKYNDPHQEPYAIPNTGAIARVDTCYYGALETALEAAELDYNIADAMTPVTILDNVAIAEDTTLEANHPVKLNLTNHTLTVENGAEFTVAQETELHNGTLRVGYGGELAGAEKIREIKNNDEIGKIRYEVALTALVNGKSTDTVKVGDAADVTVRANRAADKTVTDIATAYTIIKDEETPVGSAQNLTDEAGTYTITPKLADEEIRYEVVDALTQSAKLVVVEEEEITGKIGQASASLRLKSEVHINVAFDITGFEGLENIEEKMGLLIWHDKSIPMDECDITNYHEIVEGGEFDTNYNKYVVRTNGISAKNMGNLDGRIFFKIYIKTGENSYVYSPRYGYSPQQYCENKVSGNYAEDLKLLCVALMNYGAAAQEYFAEEGKYTLPKDNNGNVVLMNDVACFDAYQSKMNQYDASMVDSLAAADKAKHVNFKADTTAINKVQSFISLTGALQLNFKTSCVTTDYTESGVLVWPENVYNSVDVLTWENAVKLPSGVSGASSYETRFTGIAAKDMGKTIFGCSYIKVGDEYKYYGIYKNSIEAYAQTMLKTADGTLENLMKSTVVYGDYAKQYFANNEDNIS